MVPPNKSLTFFSYFKQQSFSLIQMAITRFKYSLMIQLVD